MVDLVAESEEPGPESREPKPRTEQRQDPGRGGKGPKPMAERSRLEQVLWNSYRPLPVDHPGHVDNRTTRIGSLIGIVVAGVIFVALMVVLVAVSTNMKRDSPDTPVPEAVVAQLGTAWNERDCSTMQSITTESFRIDRGWRQCKAFEEQETLPETVSSYPAETFDSVKIDGKYATVHACQTATTAPGIEPSSDSSTSCLWYYLKFSSFGWRIYATSGLIE
jgi:hypothetical protein